MAKYTVELGELINSGYKLDALDAYPIFDEGFRKTLNELIIGHFYFREIGAETPDRFNMYLKVTMCEIMPTYNQLFHSQTIDIDPLVNYKYTESMDKSDNVKGTSQGDSKGKSIYSKPADGMLSMPDVESNLYASDITLNSNTTGTTNASDSVTKYLKTISGVNGASQAELLKKYRDTFINVVELLLKDRALNQCFMGVY